MICPKCKEQMIGVEYHWGDSHRYDGISEWMCQKDKLRIGRWTGKILKGRMKEPPYGKKEYISKEIKHYNL